VYSHLDCAYRNDINYCDTEQRLTMVASIVQGFNQRLMSLLNNRHSCSLIYQLCCQSLNQGRKFFNIGFSIFDHKETVQPCCNGYSSEHTAVIRTCPLREKQCNISCYFMHSPACGFNPTNHINCLLVSSE